MVRKWPARYSRWSFPVKNTSVLVSGVSSTTSATITSNSLIRLDGGALEPASLPGEGSSTTAAMCEILHELGRRRLRASLGLDGQAELLHAVADLVAIDAQELARLRLIAARPLE